MGQTIVLGWRENKRERQEREGRREGGGRVSERAEGRERE